MTIQILPEALEDLIAGYRFYENQAAGLGAYFRDSVLADIDLLATNGGVHAKVFGYHRSLSKRFRVLWFLLPSTPQYSTINFFSTSVLSLLERILRR